MVKTMTRTEFNNLKVQTPIKQAPVKTMSRSQFNAISNSSSTAPKTMSRADFNAKSAPQSRSAFNWTMDQLIKPVSAASNILEDTGKTLGYGIAHLIDAKKTGSWEDAKKKADINLLGHLGGVFNGDNKRTYSTITNEIADKNNNDLEKAALKTIGYGGDFILDPLNKVKIAGLTAKGLMAEKTGKLALSAAEQANKGERALLQIGKTNILPSIGNKVLEGASVVNDSLRATKYGAKVINAGAALNSKIRPAAVSREDFKIITDAKTAARNTIGYTTDKTIQFAKDLRSELSKGKATQLDESSLLHAVEKGDKSLAPPQFGDLFDKATKFKNTNEEAWKSLGGDTLEGYGMAHVATKEVAEASRKKAMDGGFKLTSPNTPQDIHREWMKVDGKVTNIKDAGIVYDPVKGYVKPQAVEFKPGQYKNSYVPAKVEQASAQEINNALDKAGKSPIFQEDLPLAAARMGISTGKKQAGTDFLKATEGLSGEEAKALANETHFKMTNQESLAKAVEMFDKVQNIWKAQALVAPSYHIRNAAGNLWNNFLADVKTPAYAFAGNLQQKMARGVLSDSEKALVNEMEQHGIIGTGQYSGDISKTIADGTKGASWNPLSQNFGGYRANKWIGSGVEDNAKIAHYISKKAEGYGAKQAAESVKKYLFDYGDLTDVEKGVLKRVMPFYTWTSKNLPLQIQQFVNNPGKFSKIAIGKNDVESGVPQPNEKYMSDYMASNAPVRTKVDENGNTMYFLLGSWLPAASAINLLSDPANSALGMVTPALKLPYENLTNQGTFFKNTLGQNENIQKFPGQKTSYLGMDLSPQTVNNLRSIRTLNELDKLNPFGVFGTKNSPSFLQGIVPNASNVRGGKYTPETSQADRVSNSFVGKLNAYSPEDSKQYYDRDTQGKVTEFKTEIDRAISNNQIDLAKGLIKQMSEFVQQRDGQPNKDLQMYNLLGDKYFQDMAQNKQAEKNRDSIREDMKKEIRQGITSGNYDVVKNALAKDPSYAQQAIKDAMTEQQQRNYTNPQKKQMYDFEQLKKQFNLKPFYTNK